MQMDKKDYLKKAILDTQERIRDYMEYSTQVDDKRLRNCFREFAEVEGRHASKLQSFLSEMN